MDQIKTHEVEEAVKVFIASIDHTHVCALASTFHPKNWPCRSYGEVTKGSYNVCFPIVFLDIEGNEVEKWIVRIPLLPRLAFPEEKMRGEIATMKYISEKTNIPIPRVYGYSITKNNTLGFPFLLLEYIEGKTLHSVGMKNLTTEQQDHLYEQLSHLYLKLFQQQFDRVGALTLDETDEHWIFEHNRPLTITDNDQVVGGLEASQKPHQTFTSAIDYVYSIIKVIFNDFHFVRDSVFSEEDARHHLYSLHASQGIIMEWIESEFNHGPFILMHGDLRPPNIILDDNYNIISVLDWEWSHTVPAQLFVPPYWLTGEELISASKDWGRLSYLAQAYELVSTLRKNEYLDYNPHGLKHADLPLSKIWKLSMKRQNMFVAHALLKPCYFGNVYFNALDFEYYGKNPQERINDFFKLDSRKAARDVILQKAKELEDFDKELETLGLEREKPIELPGVSSRQIRKMRGLRLEREKKALLGNVSHPAPEKSKPAEFYNRNNFGQTVVQWSLISLSVALVTYSILAGRQR